MLKRFAGSLGWALQGIAYALKTQPHMRFHLLATLGVAAAGIWFNISLNHWLYVSFAVALVWVTELINTAIESVVDLQTTEYHPLAKAAKDVAAGAVLVAAINSLIVAAVVFLPYLRQ
ncbi:diacylglycerol kinase family protein [Desulfofalx alkaliphila]|uniref:diacylglycerol kinase family protein n=1 Tax=Desulfofalx alkaliphila TaxID=105483 RepID=UPI0004E224FC|nr:diacylglycerol kinase family protein [Desulfofalx alkaliphila]